MGPSNLLFFELKLLTPRLHGMSWGVKTTCFKAPGVSLGGSGVSIGGSGFLGQINSYQESLTSLSVGTAKKVIHLQPFTTPPKKIASRKPYEETHIPLSNGSQPPEDHRLKVQYFLPVSPSDIYITLYQHLLRDFISQTHENTHPF